jgi:hypothetical protein
VLTACQPNRFITGWVPYWNASGSTATIGNADVASLYSEVSMMWFGTAADGSVPLLASSSSLATTIATARASGLPVIPTIFDSSAPGVMKAVMADTARRTAHAGAIVDRVLAGGFDGIDIDYEVFAFGDHMPRYDATHSANWVSFVRTLAAKLHAKGKLLSVTVPAVWNLGTSGYTFYAQDQLGQMVDRLRLMVYDWSVGVPGPIAPNYWVDSVINYTANIARVPAHKVQLGVPAYGRHWNVKANAAETCPSGALAKPDSITLRETAALASSHGVTPQRHSSGELTFSWTESKTGPTTVPPEYVPITSTIDRIEAGIARTGLVPAIRLGRERIVTCTVRHVVFVPDATSIRRSADAALAAGWSGIAMWAVGYETADVYQALGGIGGVAPQRGNGQPTVTLESATYRTPTASLAGAITVAGLAWHPEFDLPVPVKVQVTRGATVVTTRTVLANTSRSTPALDAVTGIGPFHGLATTIDGTLPAGAYRVCVTQLAWGGAATAASACTNLTIA